MPINYLVGKRGSGKTTVLLLLANDLFVLGKEVRDKSMIIYDYHYLNDWEGALMAIRQALETGMYVYVECTQEYYEKLRKEIGD